MATTLTWVQTNMPGIRLAQWAALAAGEAGAAAQFAYCADKTVTITGTFGGGTVAIQGSNDGTNWFTCEDFIGTDLTALAANAMYTLASNPRYIRANVTGGDGTTTFNVMICGRG